MKNTFELCFNVYESTSFIPSLASVSVPFLGHVISPEGITVDPSKV
jgi:hypothetical protein